MCRRTSNRKPKRRVVEPLSQQFNCLLCKHEKSCIVTMDRAWNTARIQCRVCLGDFQTKTTVRSKPSDVYSDWLNACESFHHMV